ncbi:MAG: peptidoglycan DD-metalloendopeptidase family protein [candidate division KSB1 bacterium]|nr:peptidoglycan DD-metalloendopeptidase family protein [candidate division KSB1 bacterium]MDZ7341799.1 peptidoglycan DD-metalloendopeptidase family protein [candidate division KSB1 bacterium]
MWVVASNGQESRSQRKSRLERIRQEIDEYRQKIQQERQRELQLLDALDQVEREIDLTHQLVVELKKEEKRNAQLIEQVTSELQAKNEQLERLQDLYARRMVSFYKYGRTKDLELLLSSRSLNQKLIWFKYQRLIAANDRRNYLNILKKRVEVEVQRSTLKYEIIAKGKIIAEKTAEEQRLKQIRDKRNSLLAEAQQNKEIYLKRIREYELSAKEIQRLINLAEDKQAAVDITQRFPAGNFAELKGRMLWPVRGEVIGRFGQYRHPRWKTITENIGIDISAQFGSEVRAVSRGVVTAITWQRGRGNIVIINHGAGYYSVYTHLSQILVKIDDEVDSGQVIGNVGDSGSLRGPLLHFEIWKNNQVLNPEEWLS